MRTVNGAPRGDSDMRAVVKALNDKIDLLSRRISRMPKIPEAAAASSGGIVGMAQLVSTSGSVTWAAGQAALYFADITYGAPTDPNEGSGGGESLEEISSWLTVNGHLITLSPGWYIPVLDLRLLWDDQADCPTAFAGPYMYGGWDSAHNSVSVHPSTLQTNAGHAGLQQIANCGPTFMPEGADLHVECRSIGGAPTGSNNTAFSAAVWNITKLG